MAITRINNFEAKAGSEQVLYDCESYVTLLANRPLGALQQLLLTSP